MRNTIQSLFALAIVLLFCYGCQKKADAVTTGATTTAVMFPTYSTSNMKSPIRPCVTGQAAIRANNVGTSMNIYICASTVSHGRHWYRNTFVAMTAR